jgi:hypothetical protein
MFLKSCQQDNKQNEGIKTDFFIENIFLTDRPTERPSVRPIDFVSIAFDGARLSGAVYVQRRRQNDFFKKKRKKYIELRKHIELKIEKTEKNTKIKDEKVCRRENRKR